MIESVKRRASIPEDELQRKWKRALRRVEPETVVSGRSCGRCGASDVERIQGAWWCNVCESRTDAIRR
jgi:hypothetical protein